jgi:S1-C subfamily serine protease
MRINFDRFYGTKTVNSVLGIILLLSLILSPQIIKSQNFSSREDFKKYLFDNIDKNDPIEGIWKGKENWKLTIYPDNGFINNLFNYDYDKEYIIINENNLYKTYSIDENGKITKCKYIFQKTADKSKYLLSFSEYIKHQSSSVKLVTPYSLEISYNDKGYSQKDRGTLHSDISANLTKISLNDNEIIEFLRRKSSISEMPKKPEKVSGTGFLIGDGYVVTAAHVVNGFNQIQIRGVGGDFTKRYYCIKNHIDTVQDLAILQVIDYPFPMGKKLPYSFRNSKALAGESIFCLGYPLTSSMGEDVKLTNGIISSHSGFKGNNMQYQITAPVQPGNSGGPLFDKNGNLVGIITAKHGGAENASYALKVQFLWRLVDQKPRISSLPKLSKLVNMSLSQQFSLIKNYIYIVESEN